MTHDFLQKILFENSNLRAEFVSLEESVQTVLAKHHYTSPLQKLLAEALAISILLSALIKYEGKLTLQFRGNGAITLLMTQCSERLSVRGLIKANEDLMIEEDVIKACEQGMLAIMLDFASQSSKPYQGIVHWQGECLSDAIEVYFEKSEQLLTKIWLHYDATRQCVIGCLLQATPKTLDSLAIKEDVLMHEHLDFFKVATQIETVWYQEHFSSRDAIDLFKQCALSESVRILDKKPVTFACTCSRKQSEKAILMLGSEEANDEVFKSGYIDVTCEFCNQKYRFDSVDLALLFKQRGDEPSSPPSSYH